MRARGAAELGGLRFTGLGAVRGPALVLPDGLQFLGHVERVHGHLAGLAADGPQVHDIAARDLVHWGIISAPSAGVDEGLDGWLDGSNTAMARVRWEGESRVDVFRSLTRAEAAKGRGREEISWIRIAEE